MEQQILVVAVAVAPFLQIAVVAAVMVDLA
jgi:hypothetical protein